MISIVIFVSFWLGIWRFIWYVSNKTTEGTTPAASAFGATLLTFVLGFAATVVGLSIDVSRLPDAKNVVSVTELQIQEVTLPSGNAMRVFALSRGLDCNNSTPAAQMGRVKLLSDVIPYEPTKIPSFTRLSQKVGLL